jgi:hypothetical protein
MVEFHVHDQLGRFVDSDRRRVDTVGIGILEFRRETVSIVSVIVGIHPVRQVGIRPGCPGRIRLVYLDFPGTGSQTRQGNQTHLILVRIGNIASRQGIGTLLGYDIVFEVVNKVPSTSDVEFDGTVVHGPRHGFVVGAARHGADHILDAQFGGFFNDNPDRADDTTVGILDHDIIGAGTGATVESQIFIEIIFARRITKGKPVLAIVGRFHIGGGTTCDDVADDTILHTVAGSVDLFEVEIEHFGLDDIHRSDGLAFQGIVNHRKGVHSTGSHGTFKVGEFTGFVADGFETGGGQRVGVAGFGTTCGCCGDGTVHGRYSLFLIIIPDIAGHVGFHHVDKNRCRTFHGNGAEELDEFRILHTTVVAHGNVIDTILHILYGKAVIPDIAIGEGSPGHL